MRVRDGMFIHKINIQPKKNRISHVITRLIFITYQDNDY
jgi:hypothetical protein